MSLAAYSPWGHKRVRHDLVTNPPQSSNSMEELIICWELIVINTLSTTSDDTFLGYPYEAIASLMINMYGLCRKYFTKCIDQIQNLK